MCIEHQIQLLREWCNGHMIGNLMTKHGRWYRDMYPYTIENAPALYGPISRPLVGQVGWECYSKDRIKGVQIHYLQILEYTYQPQITFKQYQLNNQNQQTHEKGKENPVHKVSRQESPCDPVCSKNICTDNSSI